MIASVHFTAGAVAGTALGNPLLAFIFGFFFHFILDAIPHKDFVGEKWKRPEYLFLFADLLLLIFLIFFIFKPELSLTSSFFWGGFGGLLPDILMVLDKKSFIGKKLDHIHKTIHSQKEISAFLTVLIQAVLLFFFFLLK